MAEIKKVVGVASLPSPLQDALLNLAAVRGNERRDYYAKARRVMLVHQLFTSNTTGQLYDILIYVVPHRDNSLVGVTKVEYFFGDYWGNLIYPSTDRSRGFPVVTSAYGSFLCTAEVFFNDNTSVMIHRYIDFEMGASAPAVEKRSPDTELRSVFCR